MCPPENSDIYFLVRDGIIARVSNIRGNTKIQRVAGFFAITFSADYGHHPCMAANLARGQVLP